MRLADMFDVVVGDAAGVEFVGYDGSRAGQIGAPVRLELRSPIALSYFASSPGQLGLARAYVAGQLEVHGDMYTALTALASLGGGQVLPTISGEQAQRRRISRATKLRMASRLAAARLWWPVRPPPNEMRGKHGGRHSKRRDSAAISHHYDVSNAFYEIVLGPSMAYTCAVYPTEDATLEQAQYEKFDLVARKLGLREGMRLLDVGCGWGGMVMHAAEHYGVRALGVTLSRKQAEWAQKAIAERGLTDLAEVRHADYRDVTESGFDAISSIGLTEHIGESNVPGYFRFLYDKLRPGARLLNHCITR
ncbi:MAG: class I SAM-dependent methyltransferase, partial [Sciscionella sp.]|nr:class I SAM-dependent methyltransferase [Sciscionella sp.]